MADEFGAVGHQRPTPMSSTSTLRPLIRKKIIKPFIPEHIPTTSSLPVLMPTEQNALNRSQDDPRCKFILKKLLSPSYSSFISILVLSLFTIVSFKNDPCVSGTGSNGTCYSTSDCSSLGGTASGSCASGFGVCCLCKLINQSHIQWLITSRSLL